MENNIKASFMKTILMALGYIHGQMEGNIKDNGKIIK